MSNITGSVTETTVPHDKVPEHLRAHAIPELDEVIRAGKANKRRPTGGCEDEGFVFRNINGKLVDADSALRDAGPNALSEHVTGSATVELGAGQIELVGPPFEVTPEGFDSEMLRRYENHSHLIAAARGGLVPGEEVFPIFFGQNFLSDVRNETVTHNLRYDELQRRLDQLFGPGVTKFISLRHAAGSHLNIGVSKPGDGELARVYHWLAVLAPFITLLSAGSAILPDGSASRGLVQRHYDWPACVGPGMTKLGHGWWREEGDTNPITEALEAAFAQGYPSILTFEKDGTSAVDAIETYLCTVWSHLRLRIRPVGDGRIIPVVESRYRCVAPTVADGNANVLMDLLSAFLSDGESARSYVWLWDLLEENFLRVNRDGFDAEVYWKGTLTPVTEVIDKFFLPRLQDAAAKQDFRSKILRPVFKRFEMRRTFSHWQLEARKALEHMPWEKARTIMANYIFQAWMENRPVYKWGIPRSEADSVVDFERRASLTGTR